MIPIFLLNYYISPEVWKEYVDVKRASANIFKWCSKRRWTRENGQVIIYDAIARSGKKYVIPSDCRVVLKEREIILPSPQEVCHCYLQARGDLRAHRATTSSQRWDNVCKKWLRFLCSNTGRKAAELHRWFADVDNSDEGDGLGPDLSEGYIEMNFTP